MSWLSDFFDSIFGRKVPPAPHSGPACYVMYGAGGSAFSSGLDQLSALPMQVTIGANSLRSKFARQAAENDGAIYIVGHSAGAAQAIQMCRDLQAKGRMVQKLFCIDISPGWFPSWNAPKVPMNVGKCYWWVSKKPTNERPIPEQGNALTEFVLMDVEGADHLGSARVAARQIVEQKLIP